VDGRHSWRWSAQRTDWGSGDGPRPSERFAAIGAQASGAEDVWSRTAEDYGVTGFYNTTGSVAFQLFRSEGSPSWRRPQLAALGAVVAQWSLAGAAPPLVSLPTGVGKTAIALAAPFLAGARRTLVVVPSQELRRQTVAQFRNQGTLREIGALEILADDAKPVVVEATGRDADWSRFDQADVVVGLPASISPVHFEEHPPPADLFDLVVIDEAHHAPAKTWLSILDHFSGKALLLTATPHRRDKRRIPGKLVYYFPLRQALDENLYQPVDPMIVEVPVGASRVAVDELIRAQVVSVLVSPDHATSQILVRADSKARAADLAALYDSAGFDFPVLHSGLGRVKQRALIDGLRDGTHRGVVMVGMLVEGFDLPSLRIAAYHDKHKSLEPTAQLIGRLARVSAEHPQRSVLVTARDVDVYPHLEGAVRRLYDEDHDWARVLPGIIDAQVEDDLRDAEYARSFDPVPGVVDLAQIHPLRRSIIFEVDAANGQWQPEFATGELAEELSVGETFAGQRILYSGMNPGHTTLMVVTGERLRPRWNRGDELDSMEYDLHLVSYLESTQTDQPDLLLVNTRRKAAQNALLDVIGANGVAMKGDTTKMQQAFDSLQRLSVSSVGVRSTYGAARGTPSYKMFAGSSIESGLRGSDTAQTSLGHAMAQVAGSEGAFTAGVSTGKAKYWETRYTPLRQYEEFVVSLAARYWFPTVAPSGPLLPQINRGQAMLAWPQVAAIASSMDYALLGAEWAVDGAGSLDIAEVHAGVEAVNLGAPVASSADRMPLAISFPSMIGMKLVWTGEADLTGAIHPTGTESNVRRGHSNSTPLSELLAERPPTIFFLDGTTVRGRELYPAPVYTASLPGGLVIAHSWTGVDIEAETRRKATSRGLGVSVHEWLETFLVGRARRGRHRWILHNDGAGEIADYIVIELQSSGQVAVDLWHAKFAGGSKPSVRVGDFEVVSAQAIKSRRWPTDRQLWSRLGNRLTGAESPPITIIEGSERKLRVVLGLESRWERMSFGLRKPAITSTIGIVQPGLSLGQLSLKAEAGEVSAVQIVQLLQSVRDAILEVGDATVLVAE